MVKWDVFDYSSHSMAQFEWAKEMIRRLSLCGNERVLDVGCGDGKITVEIANAVPEGSVKGIDNSREMINYAHKVFAPGIYKNLSFDVVDASNMPYYEEFNVVFSNAALHWIIDQEPVLKSISKALVRGGRCLLQMGGRGNADALYRTAIIDGPAYEKWGHLYKDMPFPYGFYGPDEYSKWLVAAGLSPTRVLLRDRDMVQKGVEGLASWIRTTWMPYTECVPETERSEFIHAIVEGYLERFPLDNNGNAHIPMVRLEVEAVK